jgi:hypothetical protein
MRRHFFLYHPNGCPSGVSTSRLRPETAAGTVMRPPAAAGHPKKKKLHCLQVEMAGIVDDAVRLSGKWPHLPQ